MSSEPRLVVVDWTDLTTSATANTETTTLLVPAPGAGLRRRVWWVVLVGRSNNTGAIVAQIQDSLGLVGNLGLGGGPAPTADALVFPGGVPMPENAAIQIVHSSPAASQAFRVAIGTTTETV